MRSRFVLLWSMTVIACVACGAILGIEPGNPEPLTIADATSEEDASLPPDPCEHARPAPIPEVDDAPALELPPFVVALEGLDVTLPKEGSLGIDLDKSCTCDKRPFAAFDGGSSCLKKKTPCDLDGGVDNSLAQIATQMSSFGFDLSRGPSDLVKKGKRTLLLQIAQYNGKANDREVAVGILVSRGIKAQGCPSSEQNGDYWRPGWCGDDVWTIEEKSVVRAGNPFIPAVIGRGYVRDYELVITISTGTVTLPFSGNFELPLDSASLLGKIVPLGEDLQPRDPNREPTEKEKRLYRIERGLIVGRMTSTNLLTAVGTLTSKEDPDTGVKEQVCAAQFWPTIVQTVCDAVDMAKDEALDFEPTAECVSLSTGTGFTAMPALPGAIGTDPVETGPCHPGVTGEPGGIDASYVCPTD